MEIVEKYYKYFNAKDWENFFSLLHPEVEHEINQGKVEKGLDAFKKFIDHSNVCYSETITNLLIFKATENMWATRYLVEGAYLRTDGELPEANNQRYRLPEATFFEIKDGKIRSITNYYNFQDWLDQISL